MDTVRICKRCRQPLPENAPEGLCPGCQATIALDFGSAGAKPGIAPEVAELAPFFPQLEILHLLGRGGMGLVYQARQPQLDRVVALKILPRESRLHFSFAERFSREAKALAKLNHPGIVAVYDFGQTGPYYYFVMEFVDGMNLRQLLESQTVTPHQTLEWVVQICTALEYAHDEGVVHRDIKPANILVNKKGQVKIADFGLAKLMGRGLEAALTTSQAAMGTADYMAPEQRENAQGVDHRADIYSLGVVFYEMLTGEIPMGRFDPPSKKVPVDARLDEVVLRALEREPARRYQNASEVKNGVEAITHIPIAGTGGRAPWAGGPRLLRHWSGRLAASVLAAALLVGAAIWLTPLARWLMDIVVPPTTEQRVARARKALAQYDLEGQIADAIHQLELAREKASPNTDLTDTCAWLGLAYWRRYKETQSIEDRTKAGKAAAAATNSDSGLAYLVQGFVAADEGKARLPEAVRLFRRANELFKEENCEALVGWANACDLLGESTNAAHYIEKAGQIPDKSWSDYNDLGWYYFHAGDPETARTNFQLALKFSREKSPVAWRNLGGVWLSMEKTNEALQACNESLHRRKTPIAYSLKGSVLLYEKEWAAAADSFLLAAAKSRPPDYRPDYRFWGNAGLALLHVTNRQADARTSLAEAVELAEIVLRDNPSCVVEAHVGLYRSLLGQTNAAGPYLVLALSQCSNNPIVLSAATDAYVRLRDRSNAETLIQQALTQSPDDPSTLEDAVDAFRELGEPEKADLLQKQLDKIRKAQHK